MASPQNFGSSGIIWYDLPPDFLQNLSPGRYILRKRSDTDLRCYVVLTAVQENSTGRGLQLFANDLKEFFFLDGPPTWDSLFTRTEIPYIVYPGKLISWGLQTECLIHNVHLMNTVQMGRGNMQGDWKIEEKKVFKQMEIIRKIIFEEFDCFLIDQDGDADASQELMGYFIKVDEVPNPNKAKKVSSLAELRRRFWKRKAGENEDENDNDKKRKTDEEAMDN